VKILHLFCNFLFHCQKF